MQPTEELARELLENILYHELSENQQFTLREVFDSLDFFRREANVDLLPVIRECDRILQRRERMREREEARRAFEREHRLPARGRPTGGGMPLSDSWNWPRP